MSELALVTTVAGELRLPSTGSVLLVLGPFADHVDGLGSNVALVWDGWAES